MNEQLYEKMWQSAESWLIPEFRRQYVECGKVEDCPEYDQMRDFCQAVNIVGAWAGAPEVSPESIVCNVKTRDPGITGTEQRKEDLKAAYCWLWEVVPLLSGNEGDLERASRMFLQKLNSIHYEIERLGVFRTERRR